MPTKPLIAITSDLMIRKNHETAYLTMTYANAVHNAGAIPVILPPVSNNPDTIATLLTRFDAFILSGGDDPKTEPYGVPSHSAITPVLAARQSFETQLINQLNNHPDIPVLGICLGMQMLALTTGGSLNQHLPDTHDSHADHWKNNHPIISKNESILPSGTSFSAHRQAVADPGTYQVLATAPDGVIEAIYDPDAKFRLAIQWHPERTPFAPLGQNLFNRLVEAID